MGLNINKNLPDRSGPAYHRNREFCAPGFPDYPSLNSAIEHFRFIKILSKWGPPGTVRTDFLDHMELQLKKFKGQKDAHKQKVQHVREMLDKFDHITDKVVKNVVAKNKNNPEFNVAISTKKRDDGVEVGNYIIQVVKRKYKSYVIINKLNQNTLYNEIRLYETAYLIVKALINGAHKDSEDIEQLLNENEEYNEIAKNIWLESRKLRDRSLAEEDKDAAKQTIDHLEDQLFDIKTHITSNYNSEINGEDV
ncbi:MAG: hypothetical protein CMA64_07515 [Euryarchaeota archaeon]|nr:hypothetical protein [Euryarchaeota archaeon]